MARESDATVRRDWVNSLLKNLDDGRFAQLKALNLFHADLDGTQWRLDTDPAGQTFAAFKKPAAHPRVKKPA